ncbi:DUF1349 domain-containing protein [Sodalis sp. RH14]|uniref:DUF1349 domain-containing protein n=1 Tax=Sodalis sp. RH14 TaxID=3394329 RepID=UPI0039B5DEE3
MMDFSGWRWLNEPDQWALNGSVLRVATNGKTDFWQRTWYGFQRHSGHVFGCDMRADFTLQARVRGDYRRLYDQAGLMVLKDHRHWLKAGIEYTDDQPMMGSVLTAPDSDWSSMPFAGDAGCFWLRLTLADGCVRLQYSADGKYWPLLRLCPFPSAPPWFAGVMCCTPERAGLTVAFDDIRLGKPQAKDLHDLT